jgi:TIR domain-containing protein
MIFVSHNHNDKIVVEQFAVRLRDTFGQDNVFYDSWSIQPGDGIIDRMTDALGKCKLFLFFVSKNSLQSKMVQLEWQNAIIKQTKGQTRIVPVKLDDCMMPAIMLQTLYIDLFSNGLEIALRQVVDVVGGKNTFAGAAEFSNLRAYVYQDTGATMIDIRAIHYMEPVSSYVVLLKNSENEISFSLAHASMYNGGFNKDVRLDDGLVCNGQLMATDRATVPGHPFVIKAEPATGIAVNILGVLHQKQQNRWVGVPLVTARPS